MSANAWDRQEGEPVDWFSRFERFRLIERRRSLLAVYNDEREKEGNSARAASVPSSWNDAAERWNWRGRADAYDMDQIARTRAAQQDQAARSRQVWLTLAHGMRKKVVERVHSLPTAEIGPRDAVALADAALRYELHALGLAASSVGVGDGEDLESALSMY